MGQTCTHSHTVKLPTQIEPGWAVDIVLDWLDWRIDHESWSTSLPNTKLVNDERLWRFMKFQSDVSQLSLISDSHICFNVKILHGNKERSKLSLNFSNKH